MGTSASDKFNLTEEKSQHISLGELTTKWRGKSFVIISSTAEGMSKWLFIFADFIDTMKSLSSFVLVEPCILQGRITPCWVNKTIPLSFAFDLNATHEILRNHNAKSNFEWISWNDFSRIMASDVPRESIVCDIIGKGKSMNGHEMVSYAFNISRIVTF